MRLQKFLYPRQSHIPAITNSSTIEAVINNAGRALELVDAEGSLAAYVWRFEPPDGDARALAESLLKPLYMAAKQA